MIFIHIAHKNVFIDKSRPLLKQLHLVLNPLLYVISMFDIVVPKY